MDESFDKGDSWLPQEGCKFLTSSLRNTWTVLVGLQLAAWELYCVWTDGRFGTCPHEWRVETQDQQTVLNFFTAGPLGRKGNPWRLLCLTGFNDSHDLFHQWNVMKPAVTSPFELCVKLWKIPPCLHMPVRWRVLNTFVGFLTYPCHQMLCSVLQFVYCERRRLHALNINIWTDTRLETCISEWQSSYISWRPLEVRTHLMQLLTFSSWTDITA